MPLSNEEITDRFVYHAPSKDGIERHASLSTVMQVAAKTIEEVCIDSREKSLAMTKLEESKFWASAAVARNPKTR